MNERRARLLMEENGLEALVLSTPENVLYFSGYGSFNQRLFRDYEAYVVYPLDKSVEPALITGISDADVVSTSETRVKDVRFYGTFYIEHRGRKLHPAEEKLLTYISGETYKTAIQALTEALQERGLDKRRVGVDSDVLYHSLTRQMPENNILNSRSLARLIRAVKTDEEVQKLEKAAEITEKAIFKSVEILREGITVKEVAETVKAYVYQHDAQPVAMVIGSHETAAFPNASPNMHRLEKGDIVRYDIGIIYQNYYADLGRTAFIGEPSAELKSTYRALHRGLEAEKQAIRPGVRASHLFDVAVETARVNGLTHYRRHHCGHGIGLELYDVPVVRPEDQTVVEEGMVLNIETPYYELGFGGIIIEDTLVVRSDGVEMLSKTSNDAIIV
ncbi:MAG: Xaa-Pro peptidase family protein [Candidatus Caldarchaeum sp.]